MIWMIAMIIDWVKSIEMLLKIGGLGLLNCFNAC